MPELKLKNEGGEDLQVTSAWTQVWGQRPASVETPATVTERRHHRLPRLRPLWMDHSTQQFLPTASCLPGTRVPSCVPWYA